MKKTIKSYEVILSNGEKQVTFGSDRNIALEMAQTVYKDKQAKLGEERKLPASAIAMAEVLADLVGQTQNVDDLLVKLSECKFAYQKLIVLDAIRFALLKDFAEEVESDFEDVIAVPYEKTLRRIIKAATLTRMEEEKEGLH